jgi:hypothetical protein
MEKPAQETLEVLLIEREIKGRQEWKHDPHDPVSIPKDRSFRDRQQFLIMGKDDSGRGKKKDHRCGEEVNDLFAPPEPRRILLYGFAHLRTNLDAAVAPPAFFRHHVLQCHGGSLVLNENKPVPILDDRTRIDAVSARHAPPVAHDLVTGENAMVLIDAVREKAHAGHRGSVFIEKKIEPFPVQGQGLNGSGGVGRSTQEEPPMLRSAR